MAASMTDNAKIVCPCDDFLQFEDALKRMRNKDDRIIYALNTTIPTRSFENKVDTTNQCKALYEQMVSNYEERERAIKRCISEVSDEVKVLGKNYANDLDNDEALKQLRKAQHRLRLMQKELNVDEVVRNRSLKVFYERCRNAYTPPHRPLV